MVDLLSNCQDIYSNFGWNKKRGTPKDIDADEATLAPVIMKPEPIGPVQFNQRQAINTLRMRKKSRPDFFNGVKPASKGTPLAQFKIMPTLLPDVVSTQRSLVWNRCSKCSPLLRKTLSEEVQSLGFRNILLVDSMNKDNGYFTRKFHHAAHILKTNANFKYPSDSEAILNSDRINNAIDNAALQDMQEGDPGLLKYGDLLARHRVRAAQALKSMQARMSCLLIKITAWVLFKVFGQLLTCVQVQKAQLEVIRKACASGLPVIYLPLHRSHLDYLLLTFILYNYEIKAPLVAAGDNLQIPVFGPILRGLGAFFIKRKLDPRKGKKDFVYRAILHTYMEQSLREGHSIEFFVEGGRSRSGKACLPKGGLLSVVVDAFMDGVIDDAFIVPVGISYEKLLDSGFIQEQMGRPKVMENFMSTIRAIRSSLSKNYGAVRVDFSEPFSLREFIEAAQSYVECKPRPFLDNPPSPHESIRRLPSSASLYGTDIVVEDQRVLIKGLAEHVLHDAVHSTALMSTNVLAFLLLNKYRQGVLLRSLIQDFNWLWDEILERGRDVGFAGESRAVVLNALNLLESRLVAVTTPDQYEPGSERSIDLTFVKPKLDLPDVFELSYYSNVAMSAFLGDAIVATSLIVLMGENELEACQDLDSEMTVSRQTLMEKCLDLCDILQYEFILTTPCVSLETSLGEIMHGFTLSEILLSDERPGELSGQREWADRFVRNMEWNENSEDEEEEFFCDRIKYRVCLTRDSIDRLKFYRNILNPFLEGYWQLIGSLTHLVQTEMEETQFIRLVQKTSQEKITQGTIACSESIAAETLRNGLKLLESWKVIDSHNQDNLKIIFLTEHFDSEERIADVLNILEEYRK